jgi:hypothetical protein
MRKPDGSTPIKLPRRALVVAALLLALAALQRQAQAQEPAPRIVFGPALGVAQAFRVGYRLRDFAPGAAADARGDRISVDYRLTVTPVARENDGYRLRLLVSEIERPGGAQEGNMDMVLAAALMLDGAPFEMLVDARGSLQEAADWPNLQRKLRSRADNLAGGAAVRSVGRSLVDGNDAKQVTWHLARALEAMGFARSYLGFAERTGASTISWYGSAIDVTVDPANAEGAVAITWASHTQVDGRSVDEGRALIHRDGLAAPVMRKQALRAANGPAQEIHVVEAIAAP